MKTKEELNALKEEVETVSGKLHALTDDELEQANGGHTGVTCSYCTKCGTLLGRWIWFNGEDRSMYNNYVHCPCGWEGIVDQTHIRIELW